MATEFLHIKTKHELAFYLGVKESNLNYFLYAISDDRKYRNFSIKKRSGSERIIQSPILPIKLMQEKIKLSLEAIYRPNFSVQGYVENRSIKTNALYHRRSRYIALIDLENFFPTINFGRVLGIFKSQPFNFPDKIAVLLAQICTHRGALPIGAPTSPILSNIICKGLDYELRELAREHRCKYTRYADDLVFSTTTQIFPSEIMEKKVDAIAGEKINAIIERHGFKINSQKNRLIKNNRRQLVTGIVVNKNITVKKEYIKSLRAILYNWKKYGIEKVETDFFEKYDKKNRLKDRPYIFEQIIIGKINHVGFINGWTSEAYIHLAKDLSALSSRFKLKINRSYDEKKLRIRVYTEGKTDEYYLQAALKFFNKKGKFQNLYFDFKEPRMGRGDTALYENLKLDHLVESNKLVIYLFDRDNESILKKIIDENNTFRYWGNNKYSVALPHPIHRTGKPFCIEQYFSDQDLKIYDNENRRIYQLEEFDENGNHVDLPYIRLKKTNKKSLICEEVLFEKKDINPPVIRSIAMSKNDFALNVLNGEDNFSNLNFNSFEILFDLFTNLQNQYLSKKHFVQKPIE